jgi:TM2 domain-containing membrane protein YozV
MSHHRQPAPSSGKHFTEPEIIPPSAGARLRNSDAMWLSFNERGAHRIYVTRLGPFGLVLLAFGIGLLAALVFVLVIGTFLIWISLGVLLVAATIIFALLRQSLRHWH